MTEGTGRGFSRGNKTRETDAEVLSEGRGAETRVSEGRCAQEWDERLQMTDATDKNADVVKGGERRDLLRE